MKLQLVCIAFAAALSLPAATITNASFETPALGTGFGSFQYNPSGATWVFTGNSGIAANGSAFGFNNAPNGTQVAFLQVLQTSSSFSETISGVGVGDTISFFDALRPTYSANPFSVFYNGTLLGSFTPASTTFTQASVVIPVGAPSSGTLLFQSTGTVGGDLDTAIDNITITSATPEPATVALLLPALGGLMLMRKKRRAA